MESLIKDEPKFCMDGSRKSWWHLGDFEHELLNRAYFRISSINHQVYLLRLESIALPYIGEGNVNNSF